MINYLNWKNGQGLETVDQISSDDYPTNAEYRKEKQRLLAEYRMAYHSGDLYWSSRPCGNWND